MNVLVTGISGLLGCLVAKEAFLNGHNVFGIIRNGSKATFDFPVIFRHQDLTDNQFSPNLLSDIDIVIHCAANTKMGSFYNLGQNMINIGAVEKLIDASLQMKVKRFIFVSSANTLKPGSKFNPGTERFKLETSSSRLNYVNSKIRAESIILNAIKDRGLNAIILNPTFIINPIAGATSSNKLMNIALEKSIIFYPKGGKNIVDARDVAKALIAAIEKGVTGENYIISNENFTFKEFFLLAIKERNRSAVLIPIPSFLLVFAASVLTLFEWIFKKPINFNLKSARLINSNYYYSSNKAKENLGLDPIHISDTIKTKLKSGLV